MSSQRIKIGFVGAGAMGQAAHLRNYASLSKECEVVAVAEIREDLAQEVAARYGIPRVYRTHEDMLSGEKLDAVVASQPFARHGILVPEIARAGLPVFTEKPIASSIAIGEKIVQVLEENGTWAMIGYHKRCDPAVEYAKPLIDGFRQSGEIGKLRSVRITMPPGDWIAGGFNDLMEATHAKESIRHLARDPMPDDLDEVTFGEYTTFVNYYIHQVNLLRHLLGESYSASYADPEGVFLIAHGESGVACSIEMAPYATTLDWQESVMVGFERGYVKIELPAPLAYNRPGRVEIFKDPGEGATPQSIVPQLPWVHAMRSQALHFIKAVRGEAPAPCLAPEALEDLRVAREYIRLLKGF